MSVFRAVHKKFHDTIYLDSSALNKISSFLTRPSFSLATFSTYCLVWTYTRYSSSWAVLSSSFASSFYRFCSLSWYSRSFSRREDAPIFTTTARLNTTVVIPIRAIRFSSPYFGFLLFLLFRLRFIIPHFSPGSDMYYFHFNPSSGLFQEDKYIPADNSVVGRHG